MSKLFHLLTKYQIEKQLNSNDGQNKNPERDKELSLIVLGKGRMIFLQNSQNSLVYNQVRPVFQMDIESKSSPFGWKHIFSPLEVSSLSHNRPQASLLQNTFATSQDPTSQDILLTLSDQILWVSETLKVSDPPTAQVQLSFDLKFQVLHQTENNIKSNKIGFRLYFDENGDGCCFFARPLIVETWVKILYQKLHQKGFHERFKPLKKLGKGNFATVYMVERIQDGKKFAVKAFSKQGCFSQSKGKEGLKNELAVMRALSKERHQNVLVLEGVFESDNSIYVILDLLAGGQLFHRIQERNGNFTASQVFDCMKSLVLGLDKMHKERIMHRDIKPENIMLRNQFSLEAVIVDFGLACKADEEKYLFYRCGTPGYVAPQIITLKQNQHVEPQCDIFSVGVIFHILLVKRPLFEGTKYDEVYRKNKEMNFKLEGQRYQQVDPLALDLLKKMLVADPKHRISAHQALHHPYFQTRQEEKDQVRSPVLTTYSQKK